MRFLLAPKPIRAVENIENNLLYLTDNLFACVLTTTTKN